jgi:peptidoglycan/LPS O-acetylase OafA/YrhL
MVMTNEKHFSGMDGLRAIACLMVLSLHVFLRLDIQAQKPLLQLIFFLGVKTNLGVSLFFVLSGFLLSYPFWRNYLSGAQFPSIKNYIIKRAARILPGYYTAFTASIIVTFAFGQQLEYAARRIIAGYTLTSGFHYTTFFPTTVDSPLWSISFEVFSYFLMPVIFYILFRVVAGKHTFLKGILFWVAAFLIIIGINQLIHLFLTPDSVGRGAEFGKVGQAKAWMPNYNPVGFFGHFMFGIFAAGICAGLAVNTALKEKLSRRKIFDIGAVVITLIIIIFTLQVPFFHTFLQGQPYSYPFATILLMLLVVALVNSGRVRKILDCRFMRFTGKISFGLYIWHYIIMHLIEFIFYPGYTNDNGIMRDWVTWLWVNAAMVATAYITATLSYYFIEKPVLDRAHRFTAKTLPKK